MSAAPERHLGPLLLVGMLVSAPIFCWFFLRRGFPNSLRRTVFAYTIILTGFGLMGSLTA